MRKGLIETVALLAGGLVVSVLTIFLLWQAWGEPDLPDGATFGGELAIWLPVLWGLLCYTLAERRD